MKWAIAFLIMISISEIGRAGDTLQQAEIATIQKKLAQTRSDVNSLLQTQADIYDQLEKVELELELSSKLLRELRSQGREVQSQIAAVTDSLTRLRSVSSTESVRFVEHLRQFYLHSFDLPEPLIFATLETSTSTDPIYQFRHMIQYDKQNLLTVNGKITGNQRLLTTLESRQSELVGLAKSQRLEERKAMEAVRQRDQLLARTKGQQREKLREMNDLEHSSIELGDVFAELELKENKISEVVWRKERDLNFRMKGKFYWPVNGDIATRFGLLVDNKTKTSTKSNGINITTSKGAKVVAAMTGEVLYIGWARGLEKFAVVDHGGSLYTLYGNLGNLSVSEGDQVVRGQQFATTAGSRLHFEVRDSKQAIDPKEWLRK